MPIAFSLFTICWSVSGFPSTSINFLIALFTLRLGVKKSEKGITLRFGSITNLLAVARLTVDS